MILIKILFVVLVMNTHEQEKDYYYENNNCENCDEID
jgi:hypothetical protein